MTISMTMRSRWRAGTVPRPYMFVVLFCIASFGFSDLLPETTAQSDITLVDPESAVQISTITTIEPPIRVHLPDVVSEKDQWRGVQCAVIMPRQAVFRSKEKWEKFWKDGMAPFSPKFKKVPEVDFSKDMVVGVFLGQKPDPYYEIEIRSIRTEQHDEVPVLVVRYRIISKMEAVFSPPFAIQPFHLKRVPAFQGLIVFEEIRR